MKKLIISTVIALAMVLGLLVCLKSTKQATPEKSAEKPVVLKVGGIQSTDDPSTKALYRMAETVEKLSGGTIVMQIFPAAQLGNATTEIEAVGMGSQDMFVDAGWMGTFLKDKAIDSMWFVFSGAKHYEKYINSELNKGFEEAFLEQKGIRVVASNWYRAPRSFVSKKPLKKADDFIGLKIRVPDLPGYLESVSAIGGKPTQVAWGETYLALSQGVVDAAEGPLDNLYSMKFYESAKNVTITEHNRDSMQVMINGKIFDKMSENQKKFLTQAATEAGDWYSQQIGATCEKAVAEMKKNGAIISTLNQTELNALKEKTVSRIKELDASGKYWATGIYEKIAGLDK
jgi:tripartite ATP-independent transporter DctP family solute receptor